ncbi:glycosyltransferase family 39 protein [bacterium]|nr:glycosyltransferase family 39 protein [bacterium]
MSAVTNMYRDYSRRIKEEQVSSEGKSFGGMSQRTWVQFAVLISCWAIPVWFHWGNDGIWFQGDSPRHALNALFFLDLVKEGLSDPVEYARHYYTRYPAITPQRYPPFFYCLLAGGFAVFGVGGFVAKFFVHGFALLLGIYTLLGLRRWISLEAGIMAGLVLLMPGVMRWSGAVMLNVPALALGVACLFHLRCVLDQPDNRNDYKHFCVALVFAALSIAIHPTVGVVIPIAGLWLLLDRRWRCFLNVRVLAVVVLCLVVCGLLYWLLFRLGASQFSQAEVSKKQVASVLWPEFYFRSVPSLIGWWSLPVAFVGLAWSLMIKRFRKDSIRIVCAALLTFALLQSIWAKDERYMLWACPAATWFIAHAFVATARTKTFDRYKQMSWVIPVLGLLAFSIYFVVITKETLIKTVNGFAEVAEHIIRIAPGEPVLYHGTYDGTFVFYLRSFDEKFHQQVVMVRKLQLRSGQAVHENKPQWLADMARERRNENPLDEKLLTEQLYRTQCKWLLVEEPSPEQKNSLAKLLERVADIENYQLAEVFEVDMKSQTKEIMLYRIRPPASESDEPATRFVPMDFEGRSYPPVRSR